MYSERVAVILAGAERDGLGSAAYKPASSSGPSQFRRIIGKSTTFEQTRHRIGLAFPNHRILTVLTRSHERFYEPLLGSLPADSLVLQPRYRGTAPAILYALMRLRKLWPEATVALFPANHYVEDDIGFIRHVDLAFEGVKARPDLLVLLGTTPDGPEVDYSWIEPGERIAEYLRLFKVRGIWNRPPRKLAIRLWQLGYLWSTSVIVAQLSVLLLLMEKRFPELCSSFDKVTSILGTAAERETIDAIYGTIVPREFMDEISVGCPDNLAVLPVAGVEWNDLGRPRRVIAALRSSRIRQIASRLSRKR